MLHAAARGGLDGASRRRRRRRRPRSGRAAQLAQPAATEVVMGKEEEIARIARRLDKMVTRKSAVRGAGRQDPGAPAPRRPTEPTHGENDTQTSRDPCPGPALYLVLGLLLRTGLQVDLRAAHWPHRPAVVACVLSPAVVSHVCPHPPEPGFSNTPHPQPRLGLRQQ